MARLVFSYSHADEDLRNELEKHLTPLKRMGVIETWHDRRIVSGKNFASEIDHNFSIAEVVLLLISPDFIASDYCYEIEMRQSLERHSRGETIVIPVILRPCVWQSLPFGQLLAATPDGKPIVKYPSIDDGFVEVVTSVKRALDSLKNGEGVSVVVAENRLASPSIETAKTDKKLMSFRSSNLSIKKDFTDRDYDLALKDGFDYVANFFQNSLQELADRYPEIDTEFNRRDSNSFEASIYKDGARKGHCGVWKSHSLSSRGSICYNASGISPNSYNEILTIANDGLMLGFKNTMGGLGGFNAESLLTDEGVAEYLWGMVIQPLK